MTSKTILTNDNVYAILKYYFKINKVKISRNELRLRLYSHPHFPSLLAISDCLTFSKIENKAVKIPKDVLPKMPLPGIAFLESDGGSFVLITKIKDQTIEWLDTTVGLKYGDLSAFYDDWNGNLLLLKSEVNLQVVKNIKQIYNRLIHISLALFIVGSSITAVNRISLFTWLFPFSLLIISFSSTILGLRSMSKMIENRFISSRDSMDDDLRENRNKKNQVLSAFVTFMCTNLLLTLIGIIFNKNLLQTLSDINMVLAPLITIISLKELDRKILILPACLSFITILNTRINYIGFEFHLSQALIIVIAICASFIALCAFKQYTLLAITAMQNKYAFNRIKLQPAMTRLTFNQAPTYPSVFAEMGSIKVGKADAKYSLTVITHPFCKSYSEMHKKVLNLVATNSDLKCDILLYNKFPNNNEVNKICSQILNFGNVSALTQWYENYNSYNRWSHEYFKNTDVEMTYHDFQRNWCELAGIGVVPTFLMNGIEVPEIYNVDDFSTLLINLRRHTTVDHLNVNQ